MKYYVFAIEQTLIDGVYNEYSPAVKKYDTFEDAETYFLDRLSELSNSKSHTYAHLKIINSEGGIVRKYTIREYVEQ